VAVVLGENQLASLVNDLPKVSNQLLTFFRKVLGGRREDLGLESAVQSDVALLVRGKFAMLEACVGNLQSAACARDAMTKSGFATYHGRFRTVEASG